ncbi:MAG TPA: hypothetical protein VIF40_17950 [Methylosinus sp.]|jgi:hypothetical protein
MSIDAIIRRATRLFVVVIGIIVLTEAISFDDFDDPEDCAAFAQLEN